eukprot:93840-Pleurochrysis_carterae.AAC.2
MSPSCNDACELAEEFVSRVEAEFDSDTRTREYHAEVQASLVDAYGEMRYEKLIAGKHIYHVKDCFNAGVISNMRGELIRRLSSFNIADKDGNKVDLEKVMLPILDVHRGIASSHSVSTARRERLGNALTFGPCQTCFG